MNNSERTSKPQRMCIACRQMFEKKDLLRIVKSHDGHVFVDLSGKADGRGAYVCSDGKCVEKCAKGLLSKHLGCEIPQKIYEEIRFTQSAERQN